MIIIAAGLAAIAAIETAALFWWRRRWASATGAEAWIVQSIEGLGVSLCEEVHRLTARPNVVLLRDPTTQVISVVAASAGADPRLVGMTVTAESAAGRACLGGVTAYGVGAEKLFGQRRATSRQREKHGVAFPLRTGSEPVGALVVFGSPRVTYNLMHGRLATLARVAGPVIGHLVRERTAAARELIDEETGCPNWRALERAMRDHIGEHGSLMCAAIDQLPELVRATADATLRKVARRHVAALFAKSLRADDVPACVEREEFALFLPDTCLTDALGVAKRLGSTVSESGLDFGTQRKLSCSFGVASIPETVPGTGGLFAAAHSALANAKVGGPGCVVVANEP
jgi:GGDEF domain-containing protein